MALSLPVEQRIRSFVDSIPVACRDDVNSSVRKVVDYINAKLSSSWNNPMSSLEPYGSGKDIAQWFENNQYSDIIKHLEKDLEITSIIDLLQEYLQSCF